MAPRIINMPRYFNVRGTNGSGKTTMVRRLMEDNPFLERVQVDVGEGKPVVVYHGILDNNAKRPFSVIGSYETKCGGCDTIDSVAKVAAILQRFEALFDAKHWVVYEGLMISHMIGTVGAAVKPFGDRHIMAFLDTPMQTCILRVENRRRERGDTRPFNPSNLIRDYKAVEKCYRNAINQGFKVIQLDHRAPYEEMLQWLKG